MGFCCLPPINSQGSLHRACVGLKRSQHMCNQVKPHCVLAWLETLPDHGGQRRSRDAKMSVMDSGLDEQYTCQSSRVFGQRKRTLLLASSTCGILGWNFKNGACVEALSLFFSLGAQSVIGGQSIPGPVGSRDCMAKCQALCPSLTESRSCMLCCTALLA